VPAQMKRFSDSDLEDYVLRRMDHQNKAELEERVQKDPALSQRLREVQDVLDPLRQLGQDILNEPLPSKLKAWLDKQRR
jgi:anti-sigma factor RsiW